MTNEEKVKEKDQDFIRKHYKEMKDDFIEIFMRVDKLCQDHFEYELFFDFDDENMTVDVVRHPLRTYSTDPDKYVFDDIHIGAAILMLRGFELGLNLGILTMSGAPAKARAIYSAQAELDDDKFEAMKKAADDKKLPLLDKLRKEQAEEGIQSEE